VSNGIPVLTLDAVAILSRVLVALGPLVIVPIGLDLGRPASPSQGSVDRVTRQARRLVLPPALAFAAALTLPAGALAAALAVPWMLMTALVGALGIARFWTREPGRRFDVSELAIDLGFAYLPVGGAWAFVHRSDLGVLGFAGTSALLTCAHFHFAGFGLCVLVGALGLRLGTARDGVDRAATLVAASSVALLALGITMSRTLEIIAAWSLVLGVVLVARMSWRASRCEEDLPRRLSRLSAFAGCFAAAFAAHYATIGFARLDGTTFRRMMLCHALVNALGFVGAGLLARRLVTTRT